MTECTHLGTIREIRPRPAGCEECLKTGDSWVHLRLCLTCGHVGYCDSSPNRHATKHFHQDPSSAYRVSGTRRELGLVLCRPGDSSTGLNATVV